MYTLFEIYGLSNSYRVFESMLKILCVLFSLNGGHDVARVFSCPEFQVPDSLPGSCGLAEALTQKGSRKEERKREAKPRKLTSLPSWIGIVTLAPMSADLI